jgi:hypothetical protein
MTVIIVGMQYRLVQDWSTLTLFWQQKTQSATVIGSGQNEENILFILGLMHFIR